MGAVDYTLGGGLGWLGRKYGLSKVRHAGGAIKRVGLETAVYGNRDAELLLSLVGVAFDEAAHQSLRRYTAPLMEALKPLLTGGVYMSFLEGTESQQRIRDGLSLGVYERVARLKAVLDPDNLLSYSFNIPPIR